MESKPEKLKLSAEAMIRFLAEIGQGDRNDRRQKNVGTPWGGKHHGGWRGHKSGMHRQNKHAN